MLSQDYKKDSTRPPSINLAMALHGFGIDNIAAQSAIDVDGRPYLPS